MNYNPEFHKKHGTSWTLEDLQYLIDWYDIIGVEEMSYALERTIKSVAQKATELRNKGIMPQDRCGYHERIKVDKKRVAEATKNKSLIK